MPRYPKSQQSADIIIDPDGPKPLYLMLNRGAGAVEGGRTLARMWKRQRLPRLAPIAANSQYEVSYEWNSWHGGDGHGRLVGVGSGLMPPVTSHGNAETRWWGRLTPPLNPGTPEDSSAYGSGTFGFGSYGGDGTITLTHPVEAIVEHLDYLWLIAGKKVLQVDPASMMYEIHDLDSTDPQVDFPKSAAKFDNRVYIGVGFNSPAWRIDEDGNVEEASDTNCKFLHAVAGRDKLYLSTGTNTIRTVSTGADPFDPGNWSGEYVIGDESLAITSLLVHGRLLYIGMSNGVKTFDDTFATAEIIPDIAGFSDPDNCTRMVSWHGGIVLNHVRGTFFYDGLTTPIGLDVIMDNETPLRGSVTAFAQDGAWLYMALRNQQRTKTYIVAGTENPNRTEFSPNYMAWYQLLEVDGDVTSMKVTNINGEPQLVIPEYKHDDSQLHMFKLHKAGGPPQLTDSDAWSDAGEKVLPRLYLGQPGSPDLLKLVEVDMDHASPQKTMAVYYRVDDEEADADWKLLGTVERPGMSQLHFPIGSRAQQIQLRVVFSSTGDSPPPTCRRIRLAAMERPQMLSIWTANVRFGRGVEYNGGTPTRQDARDTLSYLYEYEEGDDFVMLDPYGRRIRAAITAVNINEGEHIFNKEEMILTGAIDFIEIDDLVDGD